MNSSAADSEDSFEAYTSAVYGWAYRLVGRHHDALDIVQDVLLKWMDQCATNPPRQPRGWLRRVTTNQAIDFCRQQTAARRITVPMVRAEPRSASAELDGRLLRSDVAAALGELSENQRGVLMAKLYEEMTFAEMAAELDISVPSAKTHYLRALRHMRQKLARWAPEGAKQ